MTVVPDLPDFCWPVDTSCCGDWSSLDPAIADRATAMAGQTMRLLTGYQVGGCPITVRPCKTMCMVGYPSWYWGPYGMWMTPHTWMGQWVNSCGCQTDCECTTLDEVVLPAPVGRLDEVLLDGNVLDPSKYRLDNGNRLVALGGTVWPACQDMEATTDKPDTFAVTYLNAWPVDGLGAYAAGVLACEYAKACSGAKCRLPTGVTDVVRAGISFTVTTGDFPNGYTGMREVDAYVSRYNPNHLKAPPRVWFPGQHTPRTSRA